MIHTDQTLISGLHTGSEDAFAQVYRKFYQRVFYFAQRYVEEPDAQDVTAEAFIQVWQKRRDFQRLDGIARFLFVAVRNKCYDMSRRQQVRQNRTAELVHLMEREIPAEPFYDHQVRAALMELLDSQIDLLPQRMKEVFLLSFREGLKPAQIAERLGLSVKTVKNQKLSAIKVLKAAVAHHPLQVAILLLLLQLEMSGTV